VLKSDITDVGNNLFLGTSMLVVQVDNCHNYQTTFSASAAFLPNLTHSQEHTA